MSLPTQPQRRRLHARLFAPAVHPGWTWAPAPHPDRVHPHWLRTPVASAGARQRRQTFTPAQIAAIRQRYQPFDERDGAKPMAAEFGVSPAVIDNIVRRRTYRHVA